MCSLYLSYVLFINRFQLSGFNVKFLFLHISNKFFNTTFRGPLSCRTVREINFPSIIFPNHARLKMHLSPCFYIKSVVCLYGLLLRNKPSGDSTVSSRFSYSAATIGFSCDLFILFMSVLIPAIQGHVLIDPTASLLRVTIGCLLLSIRFG